MYQAILLLLSFSSSHRVTRRELCGVSIFPSPQSLLKGTLRHSKFPVPTELPEGNSVVSQYLLPIEQKDERIATQSLQSVGTMKNCSLYPPKSDKSKKLNHKPQQYYRRSHQYQQLFPLPNKPAILQISIPELSLLHGSAAKCLR